MCHDIVPGRRLLATDYRPERILAVPMNDDANLDLVTADDTGLSLSIFSGQGDGTLPACSHRFIGDGTDATGRVLPSGADALRLVGAGQVRGRVMTLLR